MFGFWGMLFDIFFCLSQSVCLLVCLSACAPLTLPPLSVSSGSGFGPYAGGLEGWLGPKLRLRGGLTSVDGKLLPSPDLSIKLFAQKKRQETILYLHLRFNIRVLTKCHP